MREETHLHYLLEAPHRNHSVAAYQVAEIRRKTRRNPIAKNLKFIAKGMKINWFSHPWKSRNRKKKPICDHFIIPLFKLENFLEDTICNFDNILSYRAVDWWRSLNAWIKLKRVHTVWYSEHATEKQTKSSLWNDWKWKRNETVSRLPHCVKSTR